MTYTAWTLRNDGKAIGVVQHLYGNPEDFEETLYASEWLYDNTQHKSTKDLIMRYIRAWVNKEHISTSTSAEEMSTDIISYLRSKPYKVLTPEFVDAHIEEIIAQNPSDSVENLRNSVNSELNQEFCRVRFGGVYNTRDGSQELVFRISSTGFNWYNVIWEFAYGMKSKTTSITIVRDWEATGVNKYYTNSKGEVYNQMPIDNFIVEKGNPVIESFSIVGNKDDRMNTAILESLDKGSSLFALESLPINKERLNIKLEVLAYKENTNTRLNSSYDLI